MEGLLSSPRALENLAPNQGWCSGPSSSQQVRAPLAEGKETSCHANTTFTARLSSVTEAGTALGQPLAQGGDTVTLHTPGALTIWMTDTGPMLFT